jgi:Tfp pilus assembly protein FimV
MHRSSSLLIALAVAALVGVTGCASSDDDSSAPAPAATQAASKQPAADRLDAADAAILRRASQTGARYCAGHKATAGELTGAVATLESLYQIDPEAKGSDGKTVKQTTVALQRKLRACGGRSAAKRLAKLTAG